MHKPAHMSELNLQLLLPQITEKFGMQFVDTLIDYLEYEGANELLDILVDHRDTNPSVTELFRGIRLWVE
jgi:hypothetical protein